MQLVLPIRITLKQLSRPGTQSATPLSLVLTFQREATGRTYVSSLVRQQVAFDSEFKDSKALQPLGMGRTCSVSMPPYMAEETGWCATCAHLEGLQAASECTSSSVCTSSFALAPCFSTGLSATGLGCTSQGQLLSCAFLNIAQIHQNVHCQKTQIFRGVGEEGLWQGAHRPIIIQ